MRNNAQEQIKFVRGSMKLLVVLFTDESCSKMLLENLTHEKFNYYLTANNKFIGVSEDDVVEELNMKLEQAIEIQSPVDGMLKNIDGIITLGIAL